MVLLVVQLLGRVLRVDHKEKYALPKEILKKEEEMEKEVSGRDWVTQPLQESGMGTGTWDGESWLRFRLHVG